MAILLFYFCILSFFLLHTSCTSTKKVNIPSWLTKKMTSDSSYYYETGVCGKTFFKQNAIDCARRDALVRLSVRLRSMVEEIALTVTRNYGTNYRQSINAFIPIDVLKIIVENAELVDSWFDKTGAISTSGKTYVLVRVKKEPVEKLLEKEKQDFQTNIKARKKQIPGEKLTCSSKFSGSSIFKTTKTEGVCPKTFFERDAFLCAQKDAMANLAKIIVTRVKTEIIDRLNINRQSAYVISTTFTDAVLTGAVVKRSWRDSGGNYYVEVEISEKDLKNSFLNSIKYLEEKGEEQIASQLRCLLR